MKLTKTPSRTDPQPVRLFDCVRQRVRVEADPSDAGYRERYAAELIDGFRLLSLLLFASMSLIFVVHLVPPDGLAAGAHEGPSAAVCAVLAGAGGVALLASKSIRSPNSAFLATAALLFTAVAVMSIDRLRQVAPYTRSRSSLLPILLSTLVLTAALLPLRPLRMLGLGALLLAASCLGAVFMGMPFHADLVETAGAATVVAVSVATAARSTSLRIRVHHAHASALKAERQAEAERERALLAESAISMERLAASLSHELNTPIGVLKSATQTLVRGIQKHSGFGDGGRSTAQITEDLSNAIACSTARLTEVVARIQRFANLDRSEVRLVDFNQLVQDAVALMNPPSANQTRIKLRLEPLPPIWCRPHALSAAVACILNKLLGSTHPISVDTYADKEKIIVRITRFSAATELIADSDLCFSVVEGRVRASGWDLFAARQLVHENGGNLRVEGSETGQQVVMISIPADPHLAAQDHHALGGAA